MSTDKWVWALLAGWAFCFAMSFLHSFVFQPTGDGFGKGMAVLGAFILWQIVAMLVAIALLIVRLAAKQDLSAGARRSAPVALIVTGVFWLGIAIWLSIDMYREFA